MENMIDLWPDFKTTEDVITPSTILKLQAALLGKKTQNIVTAEVINNIEDNIMKSRFVLVAPFLDNYKYELFYIEYNMIDYYPVDIYIATGYRQLPDAKVSVVNNETEYINVLKNVLTDERTVKIIKSLVAQSTTIPNSFGRRTPNSKKNDI